MPEPIAKDDPAPAAGQSIPTIPTPAVRPVATEAGGLAGADTYRKLIQPLLRSRCYDCHGAEKQKGDLRLDTPEGIRKGGKSGPVIIAGVPERSYLFELINLPEDDDDIMPPKGRPLTEAQTSWIGGWIREGADLGDGIAWPIPEGVTITADNGIGTPDSAAIQQLLDGGVLVRRISSDGGLLEIDFSHADRAAGDLRLEELAPLAANLHTLDLKRTRISDDDLKTVGAFSKLHILHLQRTEISDAGVRHLTGLGELESLNLYNTSITDASLPDLKKLTSLKKIYLWSTGVTPDGARELAGTLGSTEINMGE